MTSYRLATISAVFSALLAWVLLLPSPAPVQGYYETITIEPATPTEEDFVRVGFTGLYDGSPTSCWPVYSYSISGQTIAIQLIGPTGGTLCNADWAEGLGYGSTFDIGPLAAGEYTVELETYGYGYVTSSFTVTPDNCPSVPNPEQADANGNGVGDACDPADSDGDGFSDRVEYSSGTSRTSACGVNAWPADINNDGFVDIIGDISTVTGVAFQSVPLAPARYDIAPDPPDGFIDVIGDISRLTGLFGEGCT